MTSTQGRDQKDTGNKEGPKNLPPKDLGVVNKKSIEVKQSAQEEVIDIKKTEEEGKNESDAIAQEDWASWKPSPVTKISQLSANGRINQLQKDTIETNEVKAVGSENSEDQLSKSKLVQKKENVNLSLKLKLEKEAALRKVTLERLAEENFLNRNRVFYFPEVVKPGQDIEVFLNRSLSTLSNEPSIMIMAVFNDWRWKSFTMELNKTLLPGDWWVCKLHVPKEAYKLDFVFYNGKDVYDNNDNNDFCITVDGGMTVPEFEDFLLEEKRKELEKHAKEQAERKRREEEQKRIEAEKAAREADRAQAREEAAKSREMLKEWVKKAFKSVDDVWHIEPGDFKGGDKIRLFYNKSSSQLTHAKDIWLHGGHNKWKDGLSIIKKLAKYERRDGDWWYAEGK